MKQFIVATFLFSSLLAFSQKDSVTDMSPGEYSQVLLTSSGKAYATVWGQYLGVNRDTTASFGLSNIVQVEGGQYQSMARDAKGAVYLVYKDNGKAGAASYSLVSTDAFGNSFTGNTDIKCWMQGFLAIRNDSVYTFGADNLGVNGGKAIANPIRLSQPAGKRIVAMQPLEPQSSYNNDILMVLTSDGQVWIYPKNSKGIPYQKIITGNPTVLKIGAIGAGVFIAATVSDIYAWGGWADMVGLPINTQVPTSILSTFKAAGLQMPIHEIASDWTCAMFLDFNGNLFGIGDNVHGNLGIGKEYPDWRHHWYGKTAAPWQWDFRRNELPVTKAVQIPGQFQHVRGSINLSFHLFGQDLGGNWYAVGRDKQGACFTGTEYSNMDVLPETLNLPFFTPIYPLTVRWPANGGIPFDSTKTPAPRVSAGINQYITISNTTLYGQAFQQAGTITAYSWSKISGAGIIVSPAYATTSVTGLTGGLSVFRLTIKSSTGATAYSDVQVNCTPQNQPPRANAGGGQTITLPANVVTLDGSASIDPDGKIVSYAWSKVSGPRGDSISGVNAAKIQAFFLQPGIYVYQLTVADNAGLTSSAQVSISVMPVLPCPVVDSAGIVAAYMAAHPCPICPPQRTVSTIQATINGQVFSIPLPWVKIAYSDGSSQ